MCIYMKRRTEELAIKVSKEEKNFLLQCAEKACLSLSDFIVLSALSLDLADMEVKRIIQDQTMG